MRKVIEQFRQERAETARPRPSRRGAGVLGRTALAGLLSLLASLAISFTFVPLLGGTVSGAGLVMTIVCPLAISLPASFLHFRQAQKLRDANLSLASARDELAAAYALLERRARLDPLTGLLNRAAFLAELDDLGRNGAHGGLLFLDVDHFKSINDDFGHATGDEALRLIGSLLAELAARGGLAGRLGGEEFAIFLVEVHPQAMIEHSQRIRESVERIALRAPDGAPVPVRISIGAFHCPPRFDPLEALAASDRNLYRAKSAGRNTVVA